MSDDANISAGHGDDDALAAEYVIGVLDRRERERLNVRIARDPVFSGLVAEWELQLSGLNSGYGEVKPPPGLKAKIDRRLFGSPEQGRASSLWSSLAFWRGLSAVALAGVLVLAVITFDTPGPAAPQEAFVTYMEAENSADRFVAFYDKAKDTLRVTQLAGDKPPDKDHELWLIAGNDPPVSLGLVGGAGEKAPHVARLIEHEFVEGVTLAVSLEPHGGSPTGQPTGPVIALGPTKKF